LACLACEDNCYQCELNDSNEQICHHCNPGFRLIDNACFDCSLEKVEDCDGARVLEVDFVEDEAISDFLTIQIEYNSFMKSDWLDLAIVDRAQPAKAIEDSDRTSEILFQSFVVDELRDSTRSRSGLNPIYATRLTLTKAEFSLVDPRETKNLVMTYGRTLLELESTLVSQDYHYSNRATYIK
jgi:hypothetical protein